MFSQKPSDYQLLSHDTSSWYISLLLNQTGGDGWGKLALSVQVSAQPETPRGAGSEALPPLTPAGIGVTAVQECWARILCKG